MFKRLSYLFNPPDYELKIQSGQVEVVFGRVPDRHLAEFEEATRFLQSEAIQFQVRGPKHAKRIEFLGLVHPSDQQRLRNVFAML
ncbi:MAG: hypothetical protein KDC71_19055 [Acidobacteria bacterium]|nr:hypothetical protein [Acidobacteriota bacterium]